MSSVKSEILIVAAQDRFWPKMGKKCNLFQPDKLIHLLSRPHVLEVNVRIERHKVSHISMAFKKQFGGF